jgi:DNA-binding MarR family transcriptional regulator
MTSLPPTLEFLRRLWQLNHALERRSSHMQQTLGITAQQRMVLRCVGQLAPVPAGTLAEVLHLDPGTLSSTLRRLEERRLLKRTRDAEDSRRILVTLTAAGKRLDVPTPNTVESAVAALLAETPADELAATSRVLARFADLLAHASD